MYYRNSLKLKPTLTTRIILLLGVVPCTGNQKNETHIGANQKIETHFGANQKIETHIGATETLGPCKNEKSILNSIVKWEVRQGGKKTHTITEKRPFDGGRVRIVTNIYGESLLEINKVREADAGLYICQTGATGNMDTHADIELIVQFAPKLPWTSMNQTLHEGETDELWCNATGIPIPTIEWFRKSRVNNYTEYENIGISGNMLRIHNITRYARDIYKCHASNKFGFADGFINVDVSFPSELEVFEKELQRMITDTGVEMACAVTANPMVNIIWYKGDEEGPVQTIPWKYKVKTEDDMKDYYTSFSILTIVYPLNQADFDTYYCKAQNESGHVIASEAIHLVRRPEE